MHSLALVTGASSGIGRELSIILAKNKIPLIITGRDSRSLKILADELGALVDVQMVVCDLANPEERKLLLTKLWELKPDLIINNAGFGVYGKTISHTVQEELAMLEVNIATVVQMTLESIKLLKDENRTGIILNVSSVAAYFQPFPGLVTYAASKNFVFSFSRGVDEEAKAFGIRVLTALPGQVDTQFRARAAKGVPQKNSGSTMSAFFAAHQIWKQIQKKRSVCIFSWHYKLAVYFASLMPSWVVNKLLKRSIDKRIHEN